MKKMQIYDPAMCCPTGVCGPGVDRELIRVSTVLYYLKKNGVLVERYSLTANPSAYVENAAINELLTLEGPDILPIIMVEGEIVKTKGYPTNEEFCEMLEVPETFLKSLLTDISPGCSCNGGKC